MDSKGFLNSKTIRNALYMFGTYAAGIWESNSGQIQSWALAISPDWLDPSVPHIVAGVGALLAAWFTAQTVAGRVTAGETPKRIKGIWKK